MGKRRYSVQSWLSCSFNNISNITVVDSPVAMLRRTKIAVFTRIWSMFPLFFFPLVTPVSRWVKCLTQRSKHLSRGQNKKTKNKQKRFIGERAAPYPQARERKPQICVLIISSVSASNSEDPCQWENPAQKQKGGRSRGNCSTWSHAPNRRPWLVSTDNYLNI